MWFRSLRLGMRLLPHQATEPVPKRLETPGTVRLDVHVSGYLGGDDRFHEPAREVSVPLEEILEPLPCPTWDRLRVAELALVLKTGGESGVRGSQGVDVTQKPRFELLNHDAVQDCHLLALVGVPR